MNKILRKVSYKLHLYLGLLSGMVVFISCITGCLYVFKDEINDLTQPWKFVNPEEKPVFLPSEILAVSNKEIGNNMPTAITYGEPFDAVFVDYWNPETGKNTVYVNPYNGNVIKIVSQQPGDFDFFRFVLNGHKALWLPSEIGKPVVGYSVLCFMILLITGVMLWWPQRWNNTTLKRNFTFKKKASSIRSIFDLHNVLGVYFAVILFILCFTGLIRSFTWFSSAVYTVTSGGQELKPYIMPKSDILNQIDSAEFPLDRLFVRLKREEPEVKTIYFAIPLDNKDIIRVSMVHERGSYYKTDNLFFDQYTLKPLRGSGPYAGKYAEASAADKLLRMNLEIHDGRIFGIFGKILVFFAGLTGASLPITGMMLWYRKKKN